MAACVLLLLLGLSSFSASAELLASIDCGASDVYTDENFIGWMGDDTYIQHGESQLVQSSNGVSHVMSTLRVFMTRKKNCYSIEVDKNQQVLVRASFYYGNYDKKSSPPSFDLHIDGNFWARVVTSIDQVLCYEVIYVVKGDAVNVCVAQTDPNQFPFISALEIRSLDKNMYQHYDSSYALFLRRRVAFGAENIVRYSDDSYDRIWQPVVAPDGLIAVKNDAPVVSVDVADLPPAAVLNQAFTTSNTSVSIRLATNLPAIEVPIYINMYFTELAELDSSQKRSFVIYADDKNISAPIRPLYGRVTETYVTFAKASSSVTITLQATTDSTLPPVISAMEVFAISDAWTAGTHSDDVEALAELQNEFDILQEWRSDPCLPASYTWDWVNCSTGATPRVTALYLSSFGLSGSLPDISSMEALQTIDLHNNSLSGAIPAFLGTLPNLKQLNLADNDLSGPIPSSLSKNNNLRLVVSGNTNLCASDESCETKPTLTTSETSDSPSSSKKNKSKKSKSKKKKKQATILGSTIPSVFVVSVMAVVGFFYHKRRTPTAGTGNARRSNGAAKATVFGRLRQAVMNEIRVNVEDGNTSEVKNQTDPQVQESNKQLDDDPEEGHQQLDAEPDEGNQELDAEHEEK